MKHILLLAFFLSANHIFSQDITPRYFAFPQPKGYSASFNYLNEDRSFIQANIDSVRHDQNLLNSLSNIKHSVTFYEIKDNGSLKFLGAGISAKNRTYQVIYDDIQFQTIPYYTKDYQDTVQAYLGVGVRMIATIKTTKRGIDLSDPFVLSANREHVKGSIEIQVIGITSAKISSLVPTTTDLSTASILAAIQSISLVRSHLYGPDVIITPQVIGREYAEYELDTFSEVENKASKSKQTRAWF